MLQLDRTGVDGEELEGALGVLSVGGRLELLDVPRDQVRCDPLDLAEEVTGLNNPNVLGVLDDDGRGEPRDLLAVDLVGDGVNWMWRLPNFCLSIASTALMSDLVYRCSIIVISSKRLRRRSG